MNLHDLIWEVFYRQNNSPQLRHSLFNEVSRFISTLERKHFGNSKQTQHLDRVVAFYDFFEKHVKPNSMNPAWGIVTFKKRFTIVCATIRLSQSGMSVCGAECGFNDSYVRNFVVPYYKQREKCGNNVECILVNWRNKGTRARQTLERDIARLNQAIQLNQNNVEYSESDSMSSVFSNR